MSWGLICLLAFIAFGVFAVIGFRFWLHWYKVPAKDTYGAAYVIEAELDAKAEGLERRIKDYNKANPATAALLAIELDIERTKVWAAAAEKVGPSVADAIGKGMEKIGPVTLMQSGGASDAQSILSRFASMPVETMLAIVKQLEATGLGASFKRLCAREGFDLNAQLQGEKNSVPALPPPNT